MVCADITWVYSLSVLSLGVTLILVGVAYALGQMLNNPQFNVWAKTEMFQVFLSFFLVMLVVFLNDSFCHFKYADLAALSPTGMPTYEHPTINEDDNVMDAAGKYLANVAYFAKTEMRASRSLYGVIEGVSRYTRIPCMPAITMCMLGSSGYNVRPYSGLSGWLQILGFSMYTDTASYLTLLVQMGMLAFISGGGILMYLPFAIIMRSLPMMRQFGGGLLAICIALFIIFPGLLVVESLFWNPFEMFGDTEWGILTDAAGRIEDGFLYFNEYESIIPQLTAVAAANWGPVGAAVGLALGILVTGILYLATSLAGLWDLSSIENAINVSLQASSLAFFSATFLLALNIVAIGASAREIGRLLGQEVDLSRLIQVV